MVTVIKNLLPRVRQHLIEPTPRFWTDDELIQLSIAGIKDLWRSIVDLKQEHFCTIDDTNVTMPANSKVLAGVPQDVHKIYMMECRDPTENSTNVGLQFKPLPFNDNLFQLARTKSAIDPTNDTIFWALRGAGAPTSSPIVDVAPQVTSAVNITLTYIPTLAPMTGDSQVPIPGEADNAVIAWTVAYARAKERDDRSPDPAWISIYSSEKQNLLAALGLRQYQEPSYGKAIFEEYWGLLLATGISLQALLPFLKHSI